MDLFGFREKHTPQGVGHCRGQVLQPWNVLWLVFLRWVISYANEWEDHSNNWGTTHSLVFWQCLGASPLVQLVKILPAMRETWVQSLDWEDTLEKGKATHSNILAWRIPWTILSRGLQESDTTEWLSLSLGTVLAPLGVIYLADWGSRFTWIVLV